jgi:hypothetical protein
VGLLAGSLHPANRFILKVVLRCTIDGCVLLAGYFGRGVVAGMIRLYE